MEKIKYSGLVKFIATLVLTCSMTCFVGMLVFSLAYSEVGGSKKLQEEMDRKMAENYVCAIITNLSESHEKKTQVIESVIHDTNFSCVVIESDTNVLDDVDITDKAHYVYGSPEDIKAGYQYYFWGVKGGFYNYTTTSAIRAFNTRNYWYEEAYEEGNQETKYYLVLGNKESLEKEDLFYEVSSIVGHIRYWGANAIYYEILSGIIMLLSGVFLISICGHRVGDNEIHLRFVDRIPFLIYSGIIFFLEGLAIGGCILVCEEINSSYSEAVALIVQLSLAMAFLGIAYIGSIITKIKARKFWRYTILYYLCVPLRKIKVYMYDNKSLFWKTTLILIGAAIGLLVSGMIVGEICLSEWTPVPLFLWILALIIFMAVIAYAFVFQMKDIIEGGERIVAGQLDQPIDTKQMFSVFKKHADNINSVGEGIDRAVQEKMKSERFKTELITNVSHDIKTPLTSIINYVDLMKKQDITDPTLVEYMDVLDRQSSRLKKLIEDLMEASKASTGNLTVNMEDCDITVILSQAVGEFEDKMEAKGLIPVVTYPDEPVSLQADGRHLWRVFDNLLNNICKYAQAGTRVYINIVQGEGQLDIIFKNISASQLNISSEELMERFVRGDSSRNTEGSGLGLSIARSLTELMNGQLILDVDGDLFKVTIRFNQ